MSKYTLFSEKSKLYGWALEPNQYYALRNPDSGRPMVFKTNSQGWKDVEHSIDKPDSIFRILIVGDSYTFGIVPIESAFPRQLERLFKQNGYNVEVISIGMGGWSTDQEFEVLRREGMNYNPDLVILDFSFNDSAENLLPDGTEIIYGVHNFKPFKYTVEEGCLKKCPLSREIGLHIRLKHFLLSSAIVNRIRLLQMSLLGKESKVEKLRENARKAKNDIVCAFRQYPYDRLFRIDEGDSSSSQQIEILSLLLEEIDEYVTDNDSRLLVYALTGDNNRRRWEIEFGRVIEDEGKDYVYYNDRLDRIDFFAEHKLIKSLSLKHGIDLIEPQREYDRYFFDPHTNEPGNLAMALDLYEFLTAYAPFVDAVQKHDTGG